MYNFSSSHFLPHLNSAIAHPGLINGCACLLTAARFQGEAQTAMAARQLQEENNSSLAKAASVRKGIAKFVQ